MEAIIILIAMVAATSITLSVLAIQKYNSYHKLLNTMEQQAFDTKRHCEEITKELEAARIAMQVLTDNDNAHLGQVTQLATTVQQLSATKLYTAPNRSFVPARANG